MTFHNSGKPRGWIRYLLFTSDRCPKELFQRVVFKKNGQTRPAFRHWMHKSEVDAANTTQLEAELILQALTPLESTVGRWRWKPEPELLLESNALALVIDAKLNHSKRRLMVSVSHDHYRKSTGGIQLCLQHEEIIAVSEGVAYLQVHPWHPLPRLGHVEDCPDNLVGLVLNGADIGTCYMSTLISIIAHISSPRLNESKTTTWVVIHQMLGHLPEQLAALTRASASGYCIFWLHDFVSICPSYILQRNDLKFCGGPPIDSNSCDLCVYGNERKVHVPRISFFFQNLTVKVVSPSEVTADFWRKKSGFQDLQISVVPHINLKFAHRTDGLTVATGKPIRIAHLGSAVKHKGWNLFKEIVSIFGASDDYEFLVLSSNPVAEEMPVKWIDVSVTAEDSNAMAHAIEQEGVDLVLHWPTWPETFSFTTFEALAGSAYVITHSGSGNVAAAVRQTGRGVILEDKSELISHFKSGLVNELTKERREARLRFTIQQNQSRMSFELLEKEYPR